MSFALGLLLFATPVGHFTVKPELERSTLHVSMTLTGMRDDCMCLDMVGAEVAITGLPRHPKDARCFRALPGRNEYQVNLAALKTIHDDPDYAAELGPAWLFHDAAVFLRPRNADFAFRVRFVLPDNIKVATPWPQDTNGTFEVTATQFDAGAYVALGRLRTLEPIRFSPSFSAQLTLVDEPKAASDEQLREWVNRALGTLHHFYMGSPSRSTRPLHIVLANVPSEEAGVFGSTLRHEAPSVMLLYGDQATRGFDDDWVALHELFHLGNPPTHGRYPWLVEGLTTYYTEVLRARNGTLSQEQLWATLAQRLRANCQPQGQSLKQQSENLSQSHDWERVYWGGACLALRLDVAIREHTRNVESLDSLLRRLRQGPPQNEANIVALFDRLGWAHLASTHLKTLETIPLEPLLQSLGVLTLDDGQVTLSADAPLASIREAIGSNMPSKESPRIRRHAGPER